MTQKNLAPQVVLAALQQGATKRTQRSLEIISTICTEQNENGVNDFSVATIGRLSSKRGGPAPQAIRNASGAHYRALLHAWAQHVDGATRKPPTRPEPGVADDVLGMISDPVASALVGVHLAELRKMRAENTLLKMQAQVVIDRRPPSALSRSPSQPEVQVLSPLSILLPLEIEALRHAISDDQMNKMRWAIDEKNGRVSMGQVAVFRAGFATAIKKVLDAVG
jgi:hypothetical protein